MLRQLDQDEKEFIGQVFLVCLIIGIPFNIETSITNDIINQNLKHYVTELNSLSHDSPLVSKVAQQSLLWEGLFLLHILWILPFINPAFKLTRRFGFKDELPKRWLPYLFFQCKECKAIFKTRSKFNHHKVGCYKK